jgi:hypothetical protein
MRSIQIAAAFAALGLTTAEVSAQGVDQTTLQQLEQLSSGLLRIRGVSGGLDDFSS